MSQMYNLTATRFAHSPEKKSKKRTEIDNVIQKINRGDKVLVLLRGLPGSGKSTLGHYILNNTIGDNEQTLRNHLLSTDDYFMKNGVYNYNSMLIGDAHGWNHQRAFSAMSKGYSPIIIDNTNVQMWEMKPYAMMATDFGYFLDILEPDTHWCFNEKELAKRNKHNVPKATIRNMIERYDKNVTPIKLLTAYDCKYKLQKPPQMRSYPPLTNRGGSQVNVNSVGAIKSKSMSEPINLMDFNEPAKNMSASKNKEDENKLFNSVDNLLMHQEDCIGNVLQPVLSKASKSTDLFENIKIWGIDEDALNSWDIVTPVKENHLDKMELLPVVTIDDDDVEMKDASTNTEDKYFTSLKRIRQNCSMDDLKVLVTCNRDINRNIASKQPGVRRKLMLDKSCMTEDFISDYQAQLEQLITVFPNIPLRSIEHWYNKCNRDIDWTIEFLLAEKGEALNVSIANEEDFRPTESIDQKMGSICIDSDSDSSNADRDSPRSTKNKRKYVNAESLELKKCIESKITIGDDHYSDKILKIKHFRFGENLDKSTDIKVNRSNETSPSTESPEQLDLSDEPFEFIEMDNHGSPSNSMDQLETVDLTLGEFFVKQLEQKFGDPNLTYPQGFQTQVQVPISLARQLYAFYVESVYQQMDIQNNDMQTLMKEDEEFARKLQEDEERAFQQEEEKMPQTSQMDIPEIMREERRKNKWCKDIEKWKELNPDTLAAKMTRDKLFKTFRSVDKDVLVELLYAHNNCYKETVEILLNNTEAHSIDGDIQSIKDPPLSEDVYYQMKEDYDNCQDIVDSSEDTSARDYRQEANKYLKKRADLYQKAQRCYQKGMRDVAQFYSGLASQQTRLYEQANSKAVSSFLDEHSNRLQNFNTLDLHFLYVKEALPALDVFLDTNINLLRHSVKKTKEYLQIITGRGKHSFKGISVLRPAVENHIIQRGLSFTTLNQGMLEVKLTKNSKLTNEL